ncbi:MAG TPA: phosphate ABC transporter permease PstA, partial [Spirochaetia bacterium]|nr:phosphate ABC transporter permease PstA [Spirochaetia bacterium]
VSAALCVLPLADILYVIIVRGFPAISLETLITPTKGVAGGLANAITGTILIVVAAMVLAGPIGVFGALFTSELASPPFAALVRYVAEILTGVPSIVLGYVGYVTMVVAFGWGFSLLAAAITLMIMMVPYILRSSDIAMQKVSVELRHASLSLGATEVTTALQIVVRGAIPGITTGTMIAVGIALGETAPLIYTAGWSSYMPTGKLFHAPVGYLTYVIWTFINEPFDSAHALAYAAAFVLIVLVLCFNVVGRAILRRHAAH